MNFPLFAHNRSAGTPWHKKPLWGWGIATASSIVLNIILFGLMPGLIQQLPATPEALEDLKNIQVIRVKKVEIPPRKKKPEKITRPKPVRPIKQLRMNTVTPQNISLKPQLEFELNPKLPPPPMDLVMPAFENFAIAAPGLNALYDISELDTGLMALVKIPPIYPVRAKRRGIEGSVNVAFVVTPEGLVQDIKIIKAVPETLFNRSVINCVAHWKFKPPTIEGIPVATRAETTIKFKLTKEK